MMINKIKQVILFSNEVQALETAVCVLQKPLQLLGPALQSPLSNDQPMMWPKVGVECVPICQSGCYLSLSTCLQGKHLVWPHFASSLVIAPPAPLAAVRSQRHCISPTHRAFGWLPLHTTLSLSHPPFSFRLFTPWQE